MSCATTITHLIIASDEILNSEYLTSCFSLSDFKARRMMQTYSVQTAYVDDSMEYKWHKHLCE